MLVDKVYYRDTFKGKSGTDTDIDKALGISEDLVCMTTTQDIYSDYYKDNVYIKKAICSQVEFLLINDFSVLYADDKIKSSSTNGNSYTVEFYSNGKTKLCNMSLDYMRKAGLMYRGTIDCDNIPVSKLV